MMHVQHVQFISYIYLFILIHPILYFYLYLCLYIRFLSIQSLHLQYHCISVHVSKSHLLIRFVSFLQAWTIDGETRLELGCCLVIPHISSLYLGFIIFSCVSTFYFCSNKSWCLSVFSLWFCRPRLCTKLRFGNVHYVFGILFVFVIFFVLFIICFLFNIANKCFTSRIAHLHFKSKVFIVVDQRIRCWFNAKFQSLTGTWFRQMSSIRKRENREVSFPEFEWVHRSNLLPREKGGAHWLGLSN